MGAARLQVREAGKVSLPNGQLAVSDAFINDYPVIVSELPRGDYSVELLVAESRLDSRVAAARVQVRRESVAGWRRVGFIAIDSATGALFDPRISASITPSNVEHFNRTLLTALETSSRTTYSIAAISWEHDVCGILHGIRRWQVSRVPRFFWRRASGDSPRGLPDSAVERVAQHAVGARGSRFVARGSLFGRAFTHSRRTVI